jgi:hypothetical protein
MNEHQVEILNESTSKQIDATHMLLDYWSTYSHVGTWQFWTIIICLFALPLAVLYFAIDKEKIFLMGFYGFSINIWLNLADGIGSQLGWWVYPYLALPFTPTGFTLSSAIVPVVFILVYQWTLNHNKNFYLYSFLLAAILSFLFLPLLSAIDFFKLTIGAGYWFMLAIYTVVFLISKLIVSVFLYRKKVKGELSAN